MEAATLVEPGRFEITEADIPRPAEHQVLIRIEGCGICASNIPPFEGREWFDYPMDSGALGHEAWGTVVDAAPDVERRAMGRRVAALSYHAFAEYDLADLDQVAFLPESYTGPLPAEPLGCAFNIVRRARIAPGETVAVVGTGFLGLLVTQILRDRGARVIALSRRREALETAARMGAEETVSLADRAAAIGRVSAVTDGRLCPCVIELTGYQEPLDLAAALVAEGGRLVVAGYHQDGPRTVDMQLWNWRGIDVICAHERDPQVAVRGMREGVSAVACGTVDLDALITHRWPLAAIQAGMETARTRPSGFIKGIVAMAGHD